VYHRASCRDFIAVGQRGPWLYGSLGVSTSSDGVSDWQPALYPLLHGDGSSWARNNASTELFAYPALSGALGSQDVQCSGFWLYMTYLQPGEDFSRRYLVRRWVNVTVFASPQPGSVPLGFAALSVYEAADSAHSRVDHWATTAMIPRAMQYSVVGGVGALLTAAPPAIADAVVAVFDCYIAEWNDHMVGVEGECGDIGVASSKPTNLRTLGWLYKSSSGAAVPLVPLYRCFNKATLDHSVNNDPACTGLGVTEFLLGYAMRVD
jgi:hypothetical protein